jgi:uncharacterized damage-inducible protein DinB
MKSSAAALKAQFDLQTRLFNNVLAGVSDADSNTRNNENTNHIKWVAGHVLNSRVNMMNKMTGSEADTTYAAQFARGVPLDLNATYPSIEEIISRWNDAAPAISERLIQIPEDTLDAKAPVPGPIADESFRGLLAFLISHESYHIGQLSVLRKMAGKEAMSYR